MLAKVKIDDLLLQLGTFDAGIKAAEEELAHEIEKLKIKIQPNINHLKERKVDAEKALQKLAKAHHVEVFGEGDKADFTHGILIYMVSRPVKKIRDMLERLKKAGRKELIRVAESPDWDRLEKLSEAELIELGTERQRKEKYEYEIKN